MEVNLETYEYLKNNPFKKNMFPISMKNFTSVSLISQKLPFLKSETSRNFLSLMSTTLSTYWIFRSTFTQSV